MGQGGGGQAGRFDDHVHAIGGNQRGGIVGDPGGAVGNGEWIDAPPLEDAFVVNIGDMMEIWTNGAFVATSHRVRRVAEERYSFPLFFSADYHARIEPLAPFVSPACPPRYQSLIAGEHLFAQTAQTFSYLKSMIARGELALPDGSHALSSFGQHARHGEIGAQ